MKKIKRIFTISSFLLNVLLPTLVLVSLSFAQQSPVIEDNAELVLLSDQFTFTEGPATDSDGNVFFTDQPNNSIWKYSTEGELTLFMEDTGRSNGMIFDSDGNLITCADEHGEMWLITPEKEVSVLFDNFGGNQLNGPNDLWIDSKGGIYFTDPYYQRNYWDRTEKDIEEERVYYLTPDRQDIIIVEDSLVRPNGIIGTRDGSLLYVADLGDRKTYTYTMNEDGSLSNKQLFTEMGSDGITLDNEGNLYITGRGVTVFDKTGQQLEHIQIPQGWTGNVTFGGADRNTLFITASSAVYTLDMKVRGQ